MSREHHQFGSTIASNGTFIITPKPGLVDGITVTSQGTSWILTIYDSAVAATPNSLFSKTLAAADNIQFGKGIPCQTGIVAITSGTPGTVTISWTKTSFN